MIILGRGTSLQRLDVYSDIEDDNVAIVNDFNYELSMDRMRDFLNGKIVTQFINREIASFLKPEFYSDFGIKCVLNVLGSEYRNSPIRAKLEYCGIKTSYLPDQIIPFSKDDRGGFPTTGILSVVYSTEVLKEKNIYIIGIDFYDTNYNNGRMSKSYQKNKGVAMKDFLAQHITKTPDVNYTICTNSDWRVSLPNLEFV